MFSQLRYFPFRSSTYPFNKGKQLWLNLLGAGENKSVFIGGLCFLKFRINFLTIFASLKSLPFYSALSIAAVRRSVSNIEDWIR